MSCYYYSADCHYVLCLCATNVIEKNENTVAYIVLLPARGVKISIELDQCGFLTTMTPLRKDEINNELSVHNNIAPFKPSAQ
jgi:hypothetical protein